MQLFRKYHKCANWDAVAEQKSHSLNGKWFKHSGGLSSTYQIIQSKLCHHIPGFLGGRPCVVHKPREDRSHCSPESDWIMSLVYFFLFCDCISLGEKASEGSAMMQRFSPAQSDLLFLMTIIIWSLSFSVNVTWYATELFHRVLSIDDLSIHWSSILKFKCSLRLAVTEFMMWKSHNEIF